MVVVEENKIKINPSAFYGATQIAKLSGYSLRQIQRLMKNDEIKNEVNTRTGHRQAKGIEVIKFIKNNPIKL